MNSESFIKSSIEFSYLVVGLQSCSEDTLNENGEGTLTGTVVKKGDNTPLAKM